MNRPTTLALLLSAAGAVAQPIDPLPEGARLRIGSDRFRTSSSYARYADLSPDGTQFAVADSSHGAILIDASTGLEARKLGQRFSSPRMAKFLPGNRVAVLDYQALHIWHLDSGGVGSWQLASDQRSSSTALNFSADGDRFACGGNQYGKPVNASVIETDTGRVICSVEGLHNSPLNAGLSPDGDTLVTWGSFSGTGANAKERETRNPIIQFWDVAAGKEKFRIDTGEQSLTGLAISPNGKRMVTFGQGRIKLWDLETRETTATLAGRSQLDGRFEFSPDGKRLAGTSRDGVIQLWDVETGGRLRTTVPPAAVPPQIRWMPDGRLLAWGARGSALIFWDVTTGKNLAPNSGHTSAITGLAFSPDGKVLHSVDRYGPMHRWDVETGERLEDWLPDRAASTTYSSGVGLDPAGRFVAISQSNTLCLFDRTTREEVFTVQSSSSVHRSSQIFSADAKWLLATPYGSNQQDLPIEVWNTETGRAVTLAGHPGTAYCAALSGDGSILAAASAKSSPQGQEYEFRIWDVPGRRTLVRIGHPSTTIQGMAISGDGERLVTADQTRGLVVWHTRSGRQARAFGGEGAAYATVPVFSPDDRTVAVAVRERTTDPSGRTAYTDSLVQIWEVASGQLRREFRGHSGAVSRLAFRPDGNVLASGGSDTTILLWDVYTDGGWAGPLAKTWEALADPDATIAAAAMGRLLASPEDAVRILTERIKPAKDVGIDPEQIHAWVDDLDSARYISRERATRQLLRLGSNARRYLTEALAAGALGPEGRGRARLILRGTERTMFTAEELRSVRAVEVLERLARDSTDAADHLRQLADGGPGSVVTREATAALLRSSAEHPSRHPGPE